MSKTGLETAKRHGQALPRFASNDEAKRVLFERRDLALDELCAAASRSKALSCDFSPESLKALEQWYFDLVDAAGFTTAGMTREGMEQAISFYLGQVFVKAAGFDWVVEEFVCVPGTFDIGVRRGLVTVMVTRPADLAARPANKRRESLWREYQKLAA